MDSKAFSSTEAIKLGWDTTLKNLKPLLLIGFVGAFLAFVQQALNQPPGGGRPVLGLSIQVLQLGVSLALIRAAIRLHDGQPVELDRMSSLLEGFFPFLLTSVLIFFIVVGGLILLIVPGVIWWLRYGFAGFLVVDRKLDPMASLRESRRLTDGVKGQLFEFWLVTLGVNLLGALALGVGLLVTIPTTTIAAVHVMRRLQARAPEAVTQAASMQQAPVR